jgi:sec-independent protein translocase protein TatA
MMMRNTLSFFVALCAWSVQAFAPVAPTFRTRSVSSSSITISPEYLPSSLQRQRQSVAAVQTMGLFGLGAPEIGIILVAAAFLLGPQKIAELGKDAGKIAGELKEVPKEFQKGLSEGEKLAKINKQSAAATTVAKDVEAETSD